MDWLGRLFDIRGSLVRIALLDLTGVGYLVVIARAEHAWEPGQWVLAAVAFTAALALHKRPAVNFAVQAGLLVVALVGLDDPMIHRVGAGWTLLELTLAGSPLLQDQATDQHAKERQAKEQQARKQQATERQAAEGHAPEGPAANRQAAEGLAAERQPIERQATARQAAKRRWWAAGALCAVYLAAAWGEPAGQWVQRVFGLVFGVGVPVLLGTVIRTSAELAWQSAVSAREEHRRRESEARAARADERGAIARELHDVVAHHVASMVLRVGVARHVLPDLDARTREVFDDVHETGTTALEDLRRLVAVLRRPGDARIDPSLTAIEPGALPAALDGAVETARRAGLVVDADIDREVAGLDAVRGLAVLRLTQEALTNVTKHAGGAARVRLVVAIDRGDVFWEVTDDGGGLPGGGPVGTPPVPAVNGGHGLTGMRERVAVLGGDLQAGPAGGGWRVRTTLPGVAS
nr:histidine kinase [Actinoplanes sp. N902-109]